MRGLEHRSASSERPRQCRAVGRLRAGQPAELATSTCTRCYPGATTRRLAPAGWVAVAQGGQLPAHPPTRTRRSCAVASARTCPAAFCVCTTRSRMGFLAAGTSSGTAWDGWVPIARHRRVLMLQAGAGAGWRAGERCCGESDARRKVWRSGSTRCTSMALPGWLSEYQRCGWLTRPSTPNRSWALPAGRQLSTLRCACFPSWGCRVIRPRTCSTRKLCSLPCRRPYRA
jgi:hypothetical protein